MIWRSPPADSPGLFRVASRLVTPDDVTLIRAVRIQHPEWTRQALARRLLTAPLAPPRQPAPKEVRPMLDVNRLPLEGAGGPLDPLRTITDPRNPRGVRHSVGSIVALATCACLAGARSFEAIAQWAAECSRAGRQRLGCRRPTPPSEPTFRRVLQRVDAGALDGKIGA